MFLSPLFRCFTVIVAVTYLWPISLAAQSASDTVVFRTVLEAHGLSDLASYEFDAKPRCPEQARRLRCLAHQTSTVALVRALLKNDRPRRGHRLIMSPVRDSGSVRIVELVTAVDSVSPMYGSASLFRYVLDGDGRRVIETTRVMSETTVRRRENEA
jgi:hypothetical protein